MNGWQLGDYLRAWKASAGCMSWLPGSPTTPSDVVVGIETDRGLWVQTLVAAGYQVYAINPKAVARYRDRHNVGREVRPG